jgi:hypothetical protein
VWVCERAWWIVVMWLVLFVERAERHVPSRRCTVGVGLDVCNKRQSQLERRRGRDDVDGFDWAARLLGRGVDEAGSRQAGRLHRQSVLNVIVLTLSFTCKQAAGMIRDSMRAAQRNGRRA